MVDQASRRLTREGVPHGVMMANHWGYSPNNKVQVCSIDTLIARKERPKADLIIIDEVHQATSNGYRALIADYPEAYIVGVTATPWPEASLRHVADTVVHPISMLELVKQEYLVPFKYYSPSTPDLSGVDVSSSTKDYVTEQLAEVMSTKKLTGDIIEHWIKLAGDRPTLCFAVNIAHSEMLVERFKQSGITAEHCEAKTTDRERQAIIERLESGETKVVCNVGILCTGVDIPPCSAIIMARPTKSLNLFIQQAGRGTRTFPGKSDCMILDHAGNIQQHGFPTDEFEVDLDYKKKKRSAAGSKTCKICFMVYRDPHCPVCGPGEKREIGIVEEAPGELKELTPPPSGQEIQKKHPPPRFLYAVEGLAEVKKLIETQQRLNYKPTWVYFQMMHRPHLRQYLPAWFLAIAKNQT